MSVAAMKPTLAASPQPNISMVSTGMPTSGLFSRSAAEARIARPSRVKRNRALSAAVRMQSVTRIPRLFAESLIPPMVQAVSGNMRGNARGSGPQNQRQIASKPMKKPMQITTMVWSDAPSTGRIIRRNVSAPITKLKRCDDDQAEGERHAPLVELPGEIDRERRHLALREVDDARRAIDQHQRKRERGVDRAGREAFHDLLQEELHLTFPDTRAGSSDRRAARLRRP